MKLYTAAAMRQIDRNAIEGMGVPSLRLMESAGEAFVRALWDAAGPSRQGPVAILCGKGNNGGDGMVVARLLRRRGISPLVCLLAEPRSLSGDAAVQFGRLAPSGVRWRAFPDEASLADLAALLRGAALVVDAILGTGTQGAVKGHLAAAIGAVNGCGAFVASVDIPSGLSGDLLAPPGPCVRADLTVTLAEVKPCLVTPECAPFCGEVRLVDIGIPSGASRGVDPAGEALDDEWAGPLFGERAPSAHKGSCGTLLLVAGSLGKGGAAVLAGRGALRAGAGLLTLAVPRSVQPHVAAGLPEAMTLALPETAEGTLSMDALTPVLEFAEKADAVGIGPGLGPFPETFALARELYRQVPRPMVVDADALNAFEGRDAELAVHAAPRVLTPHPGELARLLGLAAAEVVSGRYSLAPEKARAWGAVLLLKGYRSLVTDGKGPWKINLSGGPHMAAPGMGDVLTGIVAALLARGSEPSDAASLACWWHGAAADLAHERLGGYGLLASEVTDALPAVEGAFRSPSPL